MNPGADREAVVEGARAEDKQIEERPAEGRSWEPPSWPSDSWDSPIPMRRRAIGWRGSRAQ